MAFSSKRTYNYKLVAIVVAVLAVFYLLRDVISKTLKDSNGFSQSDRIGRTDSGAGVTNIIKTARIWKSDGIGQWDGESKPPEILFQTVSDRLSVDGLLDRNTAGNISFLSRFKNPCWLEKANTADIYVNNSLFEAFGESKANQRHNAFNGVFETLRARANGSQGITWRLRCLPYFYIAGFPRCGSTDLAAVMKLHPLIASPLRKEPSYWNRIRYNDGVLNFLKQFSHLVSSPVPRPLKDYLDFYDPVAENIRSSPQTDAKTGANFFPKITGDFTPSYGWEFDGWRQLTTNLGLDEPKQTVADLIHQLTPAAKIIFIVRNPTERIFSDYVYFHHTNKKSAAEFNSLVERAIAILTDCFKNRSERACLYDKDVNSRRTLPVRLRVGIYFPFIKDWMNVFSSKQILVIRLEDWKENKTRVANNIADFLGIGHFEASDVHSIPDKFKNTIRGQNGMSNMSENTRKTLDNFYGAWNWKLAVLLNDSRFLWKN